MAVKFVPSVNCTEPIVPVADAEPLPAPVPTAVQDEVAIPCAMYRRPFAESIASEPVATGVIPAGVPEAM